MNPWLQISLKDYESHMNYPDVAQAAYLADTLGELAQIVQPHTVAVVGSAGGNGFDKLAMARVEKVVGIDINNDFCDVAFERYGEMFDHLEIITADFCDETCQFDPVQFIFGGLFFEYVDFQVALKKCFEQIVCGGYFAAVIQLHSEEMPEISLSPYSKTLEQLSSIMNLIEPKQFTDTAVEYGFTVLDSRIDTLDSGKSFVLFLFQKSEGA